MHRDAVVVVSLGGAFLKDAESIKGVANALNELSRLSKLCVVAGGGERARECIEITRELGANDAICDYIGIAITRICLLYTSPSPRDGLLSRMPSSA